MSSRLISVALPVYNGENYVREALDSILAQDFTDFELVVSDNCSTDATPAILAEYAARDSRICVSRSEVFLRQAANFNRAVSLCTSPWIKLFCHDDIMYPNCLSVTVDAIAKHGTERLGLIGNASTLRYENGYEFSRFTDKTAPIEYWDGRTWLMKRVNSEPVPVLANATTATISRRAFDLGTGFDERYMHFDVYRWMYLLLEWDYLFIPQPLTVTRIHGAQVHTQARKSLKTITEERLFYREFMRHSRNRLRFGVRAKAKMVLKPLAVGGSFIAIELMKKDYARALAILFRLPFFWWPFMPLFILRGLHYHRQVFADAQGKVPIGTFYAG